MVTKFSGLDLGLENIKRSRSRSRTKQPRLYTSLVLVYSEKICGFLLAALALAFIKTNANLTVQRVVKQKAGFFPFL